MGWRQVRSHHGYGTSILALPDHDRNGPLPFEQRPNEILLRKDLLDRQIVDIDGRKVVRVNDLRLDDIEGRLHLVAVDVGAAGLVRRLGFERPFRPRSCSWRCR